MKLRESYAALLFSKDRYTYKRERERERERESEEGNEVSGGITLVVKDGNSNGRETSANKLNNLANRATTIDTNVGRKVAI